MPTTTRARPCASPGISTGRRPSSTTTTPPTATHVAPLGRHKHLVANLGARRVSRRPTAIHTSVSSSVGQPCRLRWRRGRHPRWTHVLRCEATHPIPCLGGTHRAPQTVTSSHIATRPSPHDLRHSIIETALSIIPLTDTLLTSSRLSGEGRARPRTQRQ